MSTYFLIRVRVVIFFRRLFRLTRIIPVYSGEELAVAMEKVKPGDTIYIVPPGA